jgi:regulator of nucleoside diphosphate kinase
VRVRGSNNRAMSCLRRMRTGNRPPARSRGGTIVTIEKIVVTEADYERLHSLIESLRRLHQYDTERLDELESELNRATIVKASEVSADVITMNSRVRIKDLRSGRKHTYQIVFPKDANISENRISVLAPIGTALLGYRTGTSVQWRVPSGMRRLRILDVEYQPEAARMVA